MRRYSELDEAVKMYRQGVPVRDICTELELNISRFYRYLRNHCGGPQRKGAVYVNTGRDADIYRLHLKGFSLVEIGRQFGLTRQRVCQIVSRQKMLSEGVGE